MIKFIYLDGSRLSTVSNKRIKEDQRLLSYIYLGKIFSVGKGFSHYKGGYEYCIENKLVSFLFCYCKRINSKTKKCKGILMKTEWYLTKR